MCPPDMRISCDGPLGPGVTAKDMILRVMGELGIAAGRGCTVEYAGPAIRDLPVEARLTICNMSIELGARLGLVAPDEATFAYVRGRAFAPAGDAFDRAVAEWRTLRDRKSTRLNSSH